MEKILKFGESNIPPISNSSLTASYTTFDRFDEAYDVRFIKRQNTEESIELPSVTASFVGDNLRS